MTRNDTFFKILFAIEVALIPLVMASYLMMPTWTVGLFIAGIFVVKVWMELFKDKDMKSHLIINTIGNTLTISTLIIFFMAQGIIAIWLGTVVVVLAILFNLFKVFMNSTTFPEMLEAVDTCFMLFECLLLIALTFIIFNDLLTTISLFTLLLTSAVSVAYKIFYWLKYEEGIKKIKNFFSNLSSKMFKRK